MAQGNIVIQLYKFFCTTSVSLPPGVAPLYSFQKHSILAASILWMSLLPDRTDSLIHWFYCLGSNFKNSASYSILQILPCHNYFSFLLHVSGTSQSTLKFGDIYQALQERSWQSQTFCEWLKSSTAHPWPILERNIKNPSMYLFTKISVNPPSLSPISQRRLKSPWIGSRICTLSISLKVLCHTFTFQLSCCYQNWK